MTEKYEETLEEEIENAFIEIDGDTIRTNMLAKFYEMFESVAYIKTPVSKELCLFSVMTHVDSNFDKSIKISDEKRIFERVENNVRHISFFATNNELKETEKVVSITVTGPGISFYGNRGRFGGWPAKCRYRDCNERCIDCQAAINRCSSTPGLCAGYGVCYRDENC